MKKIIVLLVLLVTFSSGAFGDLYRSSVKIKSYMIHSDGNLYIEFTENPSGIDFKHKWWGNHAILKQDHEYFDGMVAAVMSAYHSDSKLSVIHYKLLNGYFKNNDTNFEGYTVMQLTTFRVEK